MDSGVKAVPRGQWFGFLIGMTSIVGGFVLIAVGKDAAGIAAVIGGIATLAGTYIFGTRRQKRQLDEPKRELLQPPSQP